MPKRDVTICGRSPAMKPGGATAIGASAVSRSSASRVPSGAGGGIHGGGPVTSSGARGPTPRSAGMRWRTVASVPWGGISPSRAPGLQVVEQRVEVGVRDPVAVAGS